MKLLLDESVNTRLRRHFPGHDARTAEYMGWKSIGNGELLALARQEEIEAFTTRDQDIPEQQNIAADEIPIILLYARSNSLRDLLPLMPEVLEVLPNAPRGQVVHIFPPRQTEE